MTAPLAAADRALIVGVDRYPAIVRDDVAGGANLSGAVVDARTFAELLVSVFRVPPSSIAMLTDGTATRERILQEFQSWLIDGSRPGDRVFFYFAGHGARILVAGPGGTRRLTSTIVPSDARGDLAVSGATVSGMIQGTEIRELLQRLGDRDVTVVVDACFSGSISRGRKRLDWVPGMRTLTPAPPPGNGFDGELSEAADPLAARLITSPALEPRRSRPAASSPASPVAKEKGSLAVWSAATIAQVTFDHPEKPGGIFTQSLAARLRQAMRDKSDVLTASELLTYARSEAERICRRLGRRCANGLTPELLASGSYMVSVIAPLGGAAQPGAAPSAASPAAAPTAAAKVSKGEDPRRPGLAQLAKAALSHDNDFDLSVDILPSRRSKVGNEIRFRIRSSEPGTLLVLDAGPEGDLKQIFPNRYSEATSKGGRVRANATVVIPDASYGFTFEATQPGQGTLIALVADDATQMSDVMGEVGLTTIGDPGALIAALASRLQEIRLVKGGGPNGRQRWSYVAVPYVIEP
jgi:hypothetical protein